MKTLFYLSFLCCCLCACNPSNLSQQQSLNVKINKDSTLVLGETLRLDASRTLTPGTANYRWSIATAPQASQAKVVAYDNSLAEFTPDVVGDYLLHVLVATESEQAHSTFRVRVKADNTNSAPIVKRTDFYPLQLRAVVGEEQEIELEPYDAILNETLPWFFDFEDSLTDLSYSVQRISNPNIARFRFQSRNTLTFEALQAGSSSFMLRATDSEGLYTEILVELIIYGVKETLNHPIKQERLHDITVERDSSNIVLDIGTLFTDPEGLELNYDIWVKDLSIVSAQMQANQLTLSFKSSGSTTIVLRATNEKGLYSHTYFYVTVR